MAVVGFDFGTTNSLVSMIFGGRPINFLDDEGLPFPSVVAYEGARKIVGREARERLAGAGLGVHGNVVRSPKMLLGRDSEFVDGVEYSPVEIVADVVRFVCEQAVARGRGRDLDRVDRAVVTIPVNMEGYRRAALRDAFRMARVSVSQFVHEPLAALYGYFRSENDYAAMLRQFERKLMLVVDWGGGTLDLTLCRLIDGSLYQIANDGTEEVGGDVFDDAIKNEVIRRVAKNRGLATPGNVQPEARTRLLHNCERAKIDLSNRSSVELYVPSFFRGVPQEELDYSLSRDELEEIVAPLLDKGLARMIGLLDAHGVSAAQVALCLATGGMARMPAIRSRLHEWFGPQRVQVSDRSGTLVAEGAAWMAHDEARLHLAKNIELLLARNAHVPLIRAGTEMPGEGEISREQFHLYCTDPRDGFAKFQLQAPVRPGPTVLPNDPRVPLENLVVQVDAQALPFRERLELDVQIDDNLVLHAQARSLKMQGLARAEVHSLEFALRLPKGQSADSGTSGAIESSGSDSCVTGGSLSLRSNIASYEDSELVPGELLYTYDPFCFDTGRNPPQIQVEERLYYEPCAVCQRASNDPLCQCG